MAIAYRTSSTFTGAVVTIPGSVQANDCMVLFATGFSNRTPSSTPTGWTSIRVDIGTATYSSYTQAFYRVAQAGDAGTNFTMTFNTDTNYMAITLLAYSGTDTSTPIHKDAASVSSSGGATITAPSVTTTVDNCWIVECFGAVGTNAGSVLVGVSPATNRTRFSGASAYASHATSDQSQAVAGASGSLTDSVNDATASWVGTTLALAPLAVASGPPIGQFFGTM